MKAFFQEFKTFISRGNVMDMAIGIIIGGAFTAIVSSLVADIITPLIGLILGGLDFSALSIGVGGAQLMVGNFISAIINFLLTAFVLFSIIKAMNKFNDLKKKEEEPAPEPEPEIPADVQLLTEIRDMLKAAQK